MNITADEAAVKRALNDFKTALLAADKFGLEARVAARLSLGHADSHRTGH
jgi:hypothetical protein